jgi:hypothetical protein
LAVLATTATCRSIPRRRRFLEPGASGRRPEEAEREQCNLGHGAERAADPSQQTEDGAHQKA